jgi:hypothetical protein
VKTQEMIGLLQNTSKLKNEDLLQLKASIEEYPYFYLPHVILARREFEISPKEHVFLNWAAIHSSNRSRLKSVVTKEVIEQNSDTKDAPNTQEKDTNSGSTSRAKHKKIIQEEIIEAFTRNEIKIKNRDPFDPEIAQEDLSKNSTELKLDLVSESYAKLLVKQGKNSKAIEIYQKLMMKFPNKSTYFAEIIKELE